ncbi:MAG: endolytic transglycosylase MltG [Myxococcota bacterium]
MGEKRAPTKRPRGKRRRSSPPEGARVRSSKERAPRGAPSRRRRKTVRVKKSSRRRATGGGRRRRRPTPGQVWRRARALLRRYGRRFAIGLLFGVIVGGGLVGFAIHHHREFANRRPPGQGMVAVAWPAGLEAEEAAILLEDLGLTADAGAMEWYLRVNRTTTCAAVGPHLLPVGATPSELVASLCRRADRAKVKVTFPEGLHRFAMAERLAEAGVCASRAFLRATEDRTLLETWAIDADSAEGYLFPATYEWAVNTAPSDVVRRLVEEGQSRLRRQLRRHAARWSSLRDELSFDEGDLLTLASMVEKEAAVAEERPLIASVFLNRLRDPRYPHLQSDPTAMYGCLAIATSIPACHDFEGRASRAINRAPENRYSTYVTRGLPPGPIANPGEASMEAVLAPAKTAYRFFVADGGGRRHRFSETYQQHRAAVDQYRAAQKAE